jgi:integrase
MAESIRSRKADKPKKPRADFPLFPHASGRWAKKVLGSFVYFGKVADDPKGETALKLWADEKDDWLAGRNPRGKTFGSGLNVRDLCNRFLNAKRLLVASGELSPRTHASYVAVAVKVRDNLGRKRLVSTLTPEDFEELRAKLAEGVGPVTLRNDIRHTRMIFKYADDAGLIDRPVRFGPHFKIPPKRVLRLARQAAGKRMFEADELRALIDAATQPMKAMILLGINAALGNTDVSTLPLSAVDLERGWLDFPRPKTAVERRCPLWPETVAAIREAIEVRPAGLSELVFVTKYGQRWVRTSANGGPIDGVANEFAKLLKSPRCPKCGTINRAARGEMPKKCSGCKAKPKEGETWASLHRPGLNFYAVRHTFLTVAEESRDVPAVRFIMGHTDQSMADAYRERIGDERLSDVVAVVRTWLFGKGGAK